jgi:hypothetical protein
MFVHHVRVDMEVHNVNYRFVLASCRTAALYVATEEVTVVHLITVHLALLDMVDCSVNYQCVLVFWQIIALFATIVEEIVAHLIPVLHVRLDGLEINVKFQFVTENQQEQEHVQIKELV